MRWLFAVMISMVALAGCIEETDTDVAPLLEETCEGICPMRSSASDAFEPDIGVHGDEVIVVHTPLVDGLRTLEVLRKSTGWEVERPIPDLDSVLPGCTQIADPGVSFTPDGTPVITALAADSNLENRVVFSLTPDGDPQPIVPGSNQCQGGNLDDFTRSTETDDGVVLVWKRADPDPTSPSSISWSKTTDGHTWTTPQGLLLLGDAICAARGIVGPTPLVVDGTLVIASQAWDPNIRNCVHISTDWQVATSTDLGVSPIAWPTPIHVGDDVWVGGATSQEGIQTPTIWRQSNGWAPEPILALASEGATTPSFASTGDHVLLTSFIERDNTWDYVATRWHGAWGESFSLLNHSIDGHNMGLSGMGHYMGLDASATGYWASWVEGVQGQRILLAAHVPLETVI